MLAFIAQSASATVRPRQRQTLSAIIAKMATTRATSEKEKRTHVLFNSQRNGYCIMMYTTEAHCWVFLLCYGQPGSGIPSTPSIALSYILQIKHVDKILNILMFIVGGISKDPNCCVVQLRDSLRGFEVTASKECIDLVMRVDLSG